MLKNKLATRGVIALGLLCGCMTAAAVNFGFMKNSPISRFDDMDLEIFQSTVISALDNAGDGQVVNWENPDSGFTGQVFMLSTDDSGSQVCRQIRIVNVAGNLNSNLHYNACKDDIAGWQIVPAQGPPPTAAEDALPGNE